MVRRPVRDRLEGDFPVLEQSRIIDVEDSDTEADVDVTDSVIKAELEPIEDDITFESMDDLPDSPMLKRYVKRVASYLDASEKQIINAKPTKDYMKKLGVWKLAVRKNT